MSDQNPETWPLRPSHSSSVLRGICLALKDVIEEEGGGDVSRRGYLKMFSLALAAEVFSGEVSHFFGSRMGEDGALLEELENRYEGEEQERSYE